MIMSPRVARPGRTRYAAPMTVSFTAEEREWLERERAYRHTSAAAIVRAALAAYRRARELQQHP